MRKRERESVDADGGVARIRAERGTGIVNGGRGPSGGGWGKEGKGKEGEKEQTMPDKKL